MTWAVNAGNFYPFELFERYQFSRRLFRQSQRRHPTCAVSQLLECASFANDFDRLIEGQRTGSPCCRHFAHTVTSHSLGLDTLRAQQGGQGYLYRKQQRRGN